MKNSFISLLIFSFAFAMAGCKKESEPCGVATVDVYNTPEDSLCFGTWEWSYTVKWIKDWQNQWIVIDTLFPSQHEAGFETLQFVNGTVDESEIRFNINGKLVCGCYESRNSALFHTSFGPSDTVVSGIFQNWNAAGFSGLGVDVYIPKTNGEPIFAQISGLKLFYVVDEEAQGLFYRSMFAKVESP